MPANTSGQAAIYARISEDHQDGAGVERQIKDSQKLAQASGFTVLESHVFVDNSISAYSGKKRPAFDALLDAMAAGTVQAVIAWAPDRISRKTMELLEFRMKADMAGVRLIYVQGGEQDLGDPNGELTTTIFAAVSQWESAIKSKRVAAAAQQRALSGRPKVGVRQFGYLPGGMELHPQEAPALKQAVANVLAGASVRSQAVRLNELGLVTPSRVNSTTGQERGRNPWTGSTLRNTLLAPTIAGLVVYKGQIHPDVKAQWPAIITPEQHHAISALLKNPARRTNGGTGRGTKYLGSGLFRCGCPSCHATMVTTAGKVTQAHPTREQARAYVCVAKHTGLATPGTRHVTRNVKDLDRYVGKAVVARLKSPDFLDALSTSSGEEMAALIEERNTVQTTLDEIGKALSAGLMTVSQATTANAGRLERLAQINEQLKAADNSGALRHLDSMEDPALWWVTADLESRRAVMDALVTVTILPRPRRRVPFDPEAIRLDWKV